MWDTTVKRVVELDKWLVSATSQRCLDLPVFTGVAQNHPCSLHFRRTIPNRCSVQTTPSLHRLMEKLHTPAHLHVIPSTLSITQAVILFHTAWHQDHQRLVYKRYRLSISMVSEVLYLNNSFLVSQTSNWVINFSYLVW